jgi:hypothetical protein
MKNVDESIKDALKNSYNIEIKDITLGPYDQIERNKNEYKKITFLSLSEKAQEKFLEITYWDRELYYYYNQSSSPGLNFFI